jgi:hypothetical protein
MFRQNSILLVPGLESMDAIRYAASIGVAIAGAVALVVDFRDQKSRRITRTGLILITAIIGCGVALAVVQAISDDLERQRRLADQKARMQIAVASSRCSSRSHAPHSPPYNLESHST